MPRGRKKKEIKQDEQVGTVRVEADSVEAVQPVDDDADAPGIQAGKKPKFQPHE